MAQIHLLTHIYSFDSHYLIPLLFSSYFQYPSGYAVYAGAATGAIRSYFGSDVIDLSHTFPAGSSVVEPRIPAGSGGFVGGVTDVANSGPASVGYSPARDVTMRWASLSDLARDAAYSRRTGGIHFKWSDINGRALGAQVAKVAYDKYTSLQYATLEPLATRWGAGDRYAVTNSGATGSNRGLGRRL